jgi:hypothetical protein
MVRNILDVNSIGFPRLLCSLFATVFVKIEVDCSQTCALLMLLTNNQNPESRESDL